MCRLNYEEKRLYIHAKADVDNDDCYVIATSIDSWSMECCFAKSSTCIHTISGIKHIVETEVFISSFKITLNIDQYTSHAVQQA